MEKSRETDNIGYTRHKKKTNKTKNTTQYVLDITIHKTLTRSDTQNTGQNKH